VPPLSPSATPVYHERYLSEERFPNFVRLTGPAAPPAAAACPFHAAATGTSAEPRPIHPARKALQP
jgi:hypothetical protein